MKCYPIGAAIVLLMLTGCGGMARMARVDPAGITVRTAEIPVPKSKKRDKGGKADTGTVEAAEQRCALARQIKGDRKQAINLDCFRFQPGDTDTAYVSASAAEGKDARNRLQDVLLNQANFVCQLEKGRFYANRATLDSALDFTSTGLSAASTIVAGELAKSILSGVAGLSTATRSNLNANVYQNQLVPAIGRVIDATRKDMLVDLNARKRQSTTDYSVDEMIRLVNDYHRTCSFENGVQLLIAAALNKEGVDATIQQINLRNEITWLKGQIDAQMALKENLKGQDKAEKTAGATIEALVARQKEALLKLSESQQGSNSVITGPVAEEQQ